MLGEALVAVWIVSTVAYLVRQQLRGDLAAPRRGVPPLPFRGAPAAPRPRHSSVRRERAA